MLKLLPCPDVLFTDLCYSQPLLQLAELAENFLSTYLKATPKDLTFIVLFFVTDFLSSSSVPKFHLNCTPISKGGNKENLFKYLWFGLGQY